MARAEVIRLYTILHHWGGCYSMLSVLPVVECGADQILCDSDDSSVDFG